MAQPFPPYSTNRLLGVRCMFPAEVDTIDSHATCSALVEQCRLAAALRAHQRADPRFIEYAQWFDFFNRGDTATSGWSHLNQGYIDYWGGCKLLTCERTRRTMWPAAREALRGQLFRYHTSLPSAQAGEGYSPTARCFISSGEVRCFPGL